MKVIVLPLERCMCVDESTLTAISNGLLRVEWRVFRDNQPLAEQDLRRNMPANLVGALSN